MNTQYSLAIETRLEWLRWVKGGHGPTYWPERFRNTVPIYLGPLEEGETFFMDEHFCQLVDHARQEMPYDLKFERDWMIRPAGFLYLAIPFEVPHIKELAEKPEYKDMKVRIRAIGWTTVTPGTEITRGSDGKSEIAGHGCTYFRCFLSNLDYRGGPLDNGEKTSRVIHQNGFAPWSFFVLRDGEVLGNRIRSFEEKVFTDDREGTYTSGREDNALHEIRWIYAAMHLMAQRLATRVRKPTERHVRRRIENRGEKAPPFIEVVTLRRLQAHRSTQPSQNVEWNWQWEVRGHWRNQYYASEGIHKPKFIEAFTKGPKDKPFKEKGTKLFVARR